MVPARVRFPRFLAYAACLALGATAISCAQGVPPGEEDDNEALSGSCGVERWSIKTGTDALASQVNMTAQDTTIVALGALPVPSGLASGSARFPNTAETQLWRLSNVTLTQYKLENDSDYHLVLADANGKTMIAEIPSPSCVSGGPWAASISAARAAMDAKFTVSGSFQSANVPVTLTGVGFFDLPHGQTGVAPNAIELHAVLSICFPGSTVSACSAATPDFSLGAAPASVTTAQGSAGSSVISVAGAGGFTGSVGLTASGLPAGASASFSSASVAAGGNSTLSLNAGSAAAGSYSVVVTGTSGTITHTATIAWTISASGGGGFTLGASPAMVSTGPGASGTSTISVAAQGSFTGSVALSASGVPAGATASLSPTSVAAGGSSVLTLNSGSAAPGNYTVTITGASGATSSTASVTWTITGGSGGGNTIVNGDFETGNLSGWTVTSAASISASAHGGTHAAQVGTTTTAGLASIAQTFTVPAGGGPLSFWYRGVCADTLQYAWAIATLTDNTSGTTTTLLPKTCVNTGAWTQVTSGALTPGHSMTLTLSSQGENYPTASNYTLYDDVMLAGSGPAPDFSLAASPASVSGSGTSIVTVTAQNGFAGSVALSVSGAPSGASATLSSASVAAGGSATLSLSPGSAAAGTYNLVVGGASGALSHAATVAWTIAGSTGGGLVNGNFETGNLSGWTASGQTGVSSVAHGGAFSAQVGSVNPGTDSSIRQSVKLGSGSPVLTFWYRMVCTDTIQYDWAGVTVAGSSTITALASTCINDGTWHQATTDLSSLAGQTVTLTFSNHDDNNPGDASYILFDDISITGGSTGTPDFAIASIPGAVTGSGTSTITIAGSNGFAGAVLLTVGGAPAGATASVSPASVTGSGSATLTLAAGSAAAGTYSVIVTGTSGALSHSAAVSWTIQSAATPDFTVSASPGSVTGAGSATISVGALNGFGGAVSLSASGAPAGSSATVSPASVTGPGSATLSLTPGTAAAGTYSITVTGTSGALSHSAQVSWTIQAVAVPDFALSLSSGAVSSAGSANATDTVSVSPINGFSSAVALSVSGLPTGASASFTPASVAGGNGSATLTLTPGTAPAGTYSLTVSGSGGNHTHTAALSWTLSGGSTGAIQTVFIILMENHNWSQIQGSSSAPYINNTLMKQGSYANNYMNVPGIHPSLPNYLWLEAGTNFGVADDSAPSINHQSTDQHLVTLLQNAGISWKSYQEGITGTTCPLTASGLYAPKHNPMIYFDDVTNTNNASSANCIAHVRPYGELAADLQNNRAARYNFITPNLCDDMHNSTGCASTDSIANGDNWLKNNVPAILASSAYRNGGALFITFDESEGGDFPITMIVLSPKAKGGGYNNSILYNHSSTLRTMQEIFGVTPFLGDAANATDLSDLFTSFP